MALESFQALEHLWFEDEWTDAYVFVLPLSSPTKPEEKLQNEAKHFDV